MSGKKQQRKLQLAVALLLVLAVISVEMLAVRPKGIYVHAHTPFEPGMRRERVLDRINQVKSIREIVTCAPDSRSHLNSRKGFAMSSELDKSRVWTLMDRKKGIYWLRFSGRDLDYILFLNDPHSDRQRDLLSHICSPGLFQAPVKFLSSRTAYKIFPE